MATTYRKLSELIRESYYKGKSSDDANFSLKYFAEIIAGAVAECATEDSIAQSNLNESTAYSNNQFISTYKGEALLLDTDGTIYTVLPATPAGLPNGREIVSVKIEGSKCMDCVPMKAQSSFSQSLIGIPKSMVLYEVNGTKIIYTTSNPLFDTSNTATIKMVGALSGDDLLSSDLTIPKNYEGRIWDKVTARVLPLKQVPQDLINDSVSNPS